MTSVKISNLPVASALAGANVLPLVQGSTTKKANLNQIQAFVLQNISGLTIVNKTADFTIPAADLTDFPEKVYSNIGAMGQVIYSLPPAVVGMRANFYVGAAFNLVAKANGTETIRNSTDITSAGGTLAAADEGFVMSLWAIATGKWAVNRMIGSWSIT